MTQKRPLSKDTPTLIKSERLILQIVPWISSSSTSSSSTLPQNWVIISNNLEPPSPSSGAAPSSGTTNRSSVMTNGNESGINSPSPSKSISSNPIEPLSPNPNPEQIQRPQAIPISFLVHPMHVSPQIPSINSIFDFPRTPSKNSSKSPSPSLPIEKELKKTQQQSSDSQSSPNEFSAVQTDSSGSANAASAKGHTPAGLNCTNFAHSTSNLPTDDCDGITLFNQLHGPTSPLGIRSNQSSGERKASKNPRDCLTRDESTSSTMKEDEGSSTPQISVRKTSNPNMKTTKTGKILHKPKKAGGNRKSTAYERFLQQRSKYLATHRSELTAQQRMKIIVQEWAISDKNQHKTRRRSRFIGPDGELSLPLISPQSQPDSTASGSGPSSTMTSSSTNPLPHTGSNLASPPSDNLITHQRGVQQSESGSDPSLQKILETSESSASTEGEPCSEPD